MKIISDHEEIPVHRKIKTSFGVCNLETLKRVGNKGVELALCFGWQRPEGRAFIVGAAEQEERQAISRSIANKAFISVQNGRSSEPYMKMEDGRIVTVKDFMHECLKGVGDKRNREIFIEDHVHVLAVMFDSMKARQMGKFGAFNEGTREFGMDEKRTGGRSNYFMTKTHRDGFYTGIIAYDGLSTKYPGAWNRFFGYKWWSFDTRVGGAVASLHGPRLPHGTPPAPSGTDPRARTAAAYFLDPK